jgi:hypothetical protein
MARVVPSLASAAMAEQDTTATAKIAGPELRLVDRRAFVGFPELKLARC